MAIFLSDLWAYRKTYEIHPSFLSRFQKCDNEKCNKQSEEPDALSWRLSQRRKAVYLYESKKMDLYSHGNFAYRVKPACADDAGTGCQCERDKRF